jgi:subtilisin family serine protease
MSTISPARVALFVVLVAGSLFGAAGLLAGDSFAPAASSGDFEADALDSTYETTAGNTAPPVGGTTPPSHETVTDTQTTSARPTAGAMPANSGREIVATRTLVTGARIAVVARADGNRSVTATRGGPVHIVSTPKGKYAIPAGRETEGIDRSLFALETLFDEQLLSGNGTRTSGQSVSPDATSDSTIPVLLQTNASPDTVLAAGFESATALHSAGVVAAEYDASTPGSPLEALERRASVERVSYDRHIRFRQADGPPDRVFDPNVSATGEGVTVAVLDSGIDATHPDLAGQVVHRHEIVDEGTTLDPAGHGTSVAGIIAGTGNASDGIRTGLAPDAELIDVRVADKNAFGTVSEVIAGIEYAVRETDADVLTLSLGTISRNRELARTVDWAVEQGVVVVTASGNRGAYRAVDQIGAQERAITVGATTAGLDTVAPFSAKGPTGDGRVKPDLVAPGVDILTPRSGSDRAGVPYVRFGGTSAAAPYVSGTIALMLEDDPTLTTAALKRRLGSTATPLPDANAFEQGSGRVDPEDALDPAVLVDEPVVSPGIVEPGETARQSVTFENVDDRSHQITLESELAHVRSDDSATSVLSLNRSRFTLAPGESVTVEVTIDAPDQSGLYAGFLEYAVGDELRSVAFGFVRGGTVTVEKRTLTRGERVDSTPLIVFTPDLTHVQSVDFVDGTATFTSAGGTYYFMTGRTDRATGTTVLLYEKRSLNGSEQIVLDERDTVPVGMNLQPIEDVYGPLENVTTTASLTSPFGGGATRWDTAAEDADSRSIRVSPAPNVSFARTALLVPRAQQGEAPLDAADVFHLGYGTVGIDGTQPRIGPWRLVTTEHRYYRESVDDEYTITPRAIVEGVRNSRPPYDFAVGERIVQRVHRLSDGIQYRYDFEGEDWAAQTRPASDVPLGPRGFRFGVQSVQPVLRHPLSAEIDIANRSEDQITIGGTPLAGDHGLAIDRTGARSTLAVRIDNQSLLHESGRFTETRTDIDLDAGDDATITLSGSAAGATLSTNTTTTVSIDGFDPDGPGPPLLTGMAFEDASTANAIQNPARLRLSGRAFARVPTTRIWYAAGAPDEPPWVDDTDWLPASTERDAGDIVARLDLDDPRLDFAAHEPTVSVAASLESWDGHRVRTVTTDAAHVGSAPNFETATVEARLLDHEGDPVTGDSVLVVDEQRGGIVAGDRTDETGRVSFELRKNRTYTIQQLRGEIVDHEERTLDRSRPVVTALDRVTITDHRDLGTYRLPKANRTRITVTDQRGEIVPNATVSVVHLANNATAQFTAEAASNGTVVIDGRQTPGLPLSGEIEIVARPPEDEQTPQLSGAVGRKAVAVDTETSTSVALPNRAPEADLAASANTTAPGQSIILTAVNTSGPAPIERYEWRSTGPGAVNRTTSTPYIGLTPNRPGTLEATVTAIDELGNRDTARVSIAVRSNRADRQGQPVKCLTTAATSSCGRIAVVR